MAKKKQQHLQNQENQPTNTNDSEKLDSLKSLNSLLLKETVELRQLTQCLEQEKCHLQAELSRFGLANKVLEDELRLKVEKFDVEKGVLDVLVKTQMREFSEQVLAGLGEKELMGRELEGMARDAESLRIRVEDLVREKEVVELENEGRRLEIGELEIEVGRLKGVVEGLRRDELVLQDKVSVLKGKCGEGIEREMSLVKEVAELGEVRKKVEKDSLVLTEEKGLMSSVLDKCREELGENVRRVGELIEEKNEVERLKVSMEGEVFELRNEVDSLRDVITKLQESCGSQMEVNDGLTKQVSGYKDVVSRITVERDEAKKGYDEEKKKGIELRSRLVEMEKKNVDILKDLEKAKGECEKLAKINKDKDIRVENLSAEKDALVKKFNEAKANIAELKCEVESVSLNSDRILALLKTAIAILGQSNGKETGQIGGILNKEGKASKDLQAYAEELETIKRNFMEKETKVEDMKQQVELLQHLVADAQKKKSFWTIVSSVATLFAAVSVAFATTGH